MPAHTSRAKCDFVNLALRLRASLRLCGKYFSIDKRIPSEYSHAHSSSLRPHHDGSKNRTRHSKNGNRTREPVGHCDARCSGKSLSIALPPSLQTRNRNKPGPVPQRFSSAKGGGDVADHVSFREADPEASGPAFEHTLRERFPQAARYDTNGVSPGVLACDEDKEVAKKETSKPILATFDKN